MAACALILALVGVSFSLLPAVGHLVGVPVSLIALALAAVASREARRSGARIRAAGWALVLGVLGVALGCANDLLWSLGSTGTPP